jgi:hypothetical protein
VLRTVNVMHRVHRGFKAFDDPDQDLARFVELWFFPRCNQFLVPHGRAAKSLGSPN